jgi:hypothetical protein
MVSDPPVPGPDELAALHCWSFLGGWHPEGLALYDALYGVDDFDLLIELLLLLRSAQTAR